MPNNSTAKISKGKHRIIAARSDMAVLKSSDASHETDNPTFGWGIRDVRKRLKLSLKQVAASTDLSIGFLSQIERGISSPTLKVLTSLSDVLQLSVAELIDPHLPGLESETVRTRSQSGAMMLLWRSGIRKLALAGSTEQSSPRFSFSLLEFEPGATAGDELYTHSGEEAGYVVEGQLRLIVRNKRWILEPGDSFHFSSCDPHTFKNESAGKTTIVMMNLHGSLAP